MACGCWPVQVRKVVCIERVQASSANDILRLSLGGTCASLSQNKCVPGNLLAMRNGDLCYLDFGMMSEAPQSARYVRPLLLAKAIPTQLIPMLCQRTYMLLVGTILADVHAKDVQRVCWY